ncbi:tyrosine-type recombinase/integrase [Falsiruegeria mediterranea]
MQKSKEGTALFFNETELTGRVLTTNGEKQVFTYRGKAHAKSVTEFVADIDGTDFIDRVRDRICEMGHFAVLYTTHSHARKRSENGDFFRIIVPLERPFLVEEHGGNPGVAARHWLSRYVGFSNVLGIEDLDLSAAKFVQMKYMPRRASSDAQFKHYMVAGRALSVEEMPVEENLLEFKVAGSTERACRRQTGLQDGTIWTQLGKLRTCLNWAEKTGLIDRAPYIERPSKPAPNERYLNRQEIAQLLAVECAPHTKLAIRLMLSTAARVTAVLELTWDRVGFERGQVNLRAGEGQRKGRAIVPMTDSLRAALVDARKAALSDYVIEWAGGPVNSIKKGFRAAAVDAGLLDVSPHVLRHTAAVHMAEAGVAIEEIAQFLSHSDSRITASVCARYSPEHLRKAASALEFD